MYLLLIAPICAIIGLIFAAYYYWSMMKEGTGT